MDTTVKTTVSNNSLTRHIRGQGLTEYAIILSLVAIAAIGATSFFGDAVKSSFVALGSELSGSARYDSAGEVATALKDASADVKDETTLRNYRD